VQADGAAALGFGDVGEAGEEEQSDGGGER
jgi:hypothetical protein